MDGWTPIAQAGACDWSELMDVALDCRKAVGRQGIRPFRRIVIPIPLVATVYCKVQSRMGNAGHPGEVESMMNSFSWFAKNVLFADSATHGFLDNTNRHGMAHGIYRDADYGRPINFYKIMAAVEFLTFVSSFTANVSWFAPGPTEQSNKLAAYYLLLGKIGDGRSPA